jgi:hypothetical protein
VLAVANGAILVAPELELELLLELDDELELDELLLELDELELLELEELLDDELLLELLEDELLLDDELLELLDDVPLPEQVGGSKLPSCVPWKPKVAL